MRIYKMLDRVIHTGYGVIADRPWQRVEKRTGRLGTITSLGRDPLDADTIKIWVLWDDKQWHSEGMTLPQARISLNVQKEGQA